MRFALKVFLPGILIVAIAVSLTGYALTAAAFSTALETEKQKGFDRAAMLAVVLEAMTGAHTRAAGDEALSFAMRAVATGDFSAARLYASGGAPLYGTAQSADTELLEAARSGMAYRLAQSGGKHVLELLRPVQLGELTGFLYLEQDLSAAFKLSESMLQNGMRNALYAIALVGAALFAVSLYVTRGVRALSSATHAFARGDYGRRAKKSSRDEIGDLARDFNKMADSLQAHIAHMEDDARRREDFVASFAHELKTPLTSIIGYADTLRSMEMNEESRFACANYIFTEGRRLERLSLKLLELMVLERQEFALSRVPMVPLVESLLETVGASLHQRYGVLFKTELDCGVVEAEPDLLRTLLINLLENAAKASKPGQTVLVSGRASEGGYRVAVTDEGVGIPKDELKRVTEAFYMLDKSRARAQNGAGLGLALCVSIAKLHHAKLLIESESGKGAEVSMELLCAKEEENA